MKPQKETFTLILLRIIFIIFALIISYAFGNTVLQTQTAKIITPIIGLAVAITLVILEVFFTKDMIPYISIIIIGLMFGFLVSYIFVKLFLILPVIEDFKNSSPQEYEKYEFWIKLVLSFVITYLVLLVVIKAQSEFKFLIPFIELKKETNTQAKGELYVVDTSVLIDGRIYDMVENNLLRGTIIAPRFILEETQFLADSEDKLKRTKGKRGIDTLAKLQNSRNISLEIYESQLPFTGTVDQKLIRLSKTLGAILISNDMNLCKLAQVEGVKYININILANVLKPVFLPGEELSIRLIKHGENPGQGVGFLEDGSMVVVENSAPLIGKTVNVVVASIITTTAGRIIFAQLK
ncbi:MAG: PIN/TRAM domain-containing protein [Planctomycetota bacterium]